MPNEDFPMTKPNPTSPSEWAMQAAGDLFDQLFPSYTKWRAALSMYRKHQIILDAFDRHTAADEGVRLAALEEVIRWHEERGRHHRDCLRESNHEYCQVRAIQHEHSAAHIRTLLPAKPEEGK